MKPYPTNHPYRQAGLEKAGRRWNTMKRSVLGAGLLAALCALPASNAAAAFWDVQQTPWYGGVKHFCGNTLVNTATTFNNSGSLTYNTSTLPGSDDLTGSGGNYWYGLGVLVAGSDGATINNNSGGTIQSVVTGYGAEEAAGIYSLQNVTINNSGTVDGEVLNNDGIAYGIYTEGGVANINNNAGATISATSQWSATGINASQRQNIVNNGTVKVTATGGTQGNTANRSHAYAVNLFSYDANGNSPIYFENNGTITASCTGADNNDARGVNIWSEGGKATFKNTGTINATMSGSQGESDGVYFGADNADCSFYNSGTISCSGGPGCFALGFENDSQVGNMYFYNSGKITTTSPFAIMMGNYSYGPGQCGYFWGTNSGTIQGGWCGLGWPGGMTFYNSGDILCGQMWLGAGDDKFIISGLPTVDPEIDAGEGNNTLTFDLNGTLQQINGQSASGTSFSGLSSQGSIVVSGKTYRWKNFQNVSGNVYPRSNPTPTTTGGTYKLLSRYSGKAMDVWGAVTGNGSQIAQCSYNGGANQQWAITDTGSGNYKIIGVQSGKSLDIYNGLTANDTKVELWDFWGGSMQTFKFTATTNGYYRISPNCAPGSCLDVEGPSTADGAKVHLWQWVNANNQQWLLQPVDGTAKLISKYSGKSLCAYGGQTANGTQIHQWDYINSSYTDQQWTLTDTGSGNYKFINVKSGRALDISGGGTANDTKVQLWDDYGNTAQRYKLTSTEVGQFRISPNCATGSCLDVSGPSTANGTKIHLWQWLNADNQKWSVQKP